MVRIWNEETGASVIVPSAKTTKDALASLCLEPERRHTVVNRRRNADRGLRQQRESVQHNDPSVPKSVTAGRSQSLSTPRRIKQDPKTIDLSKLTPEEAQTLFYTYLNFSLHDPEELKRLYDGDFSQLLEKMRNDNIPFANLLSFEAMIPVLAPVTNLTADQSNVTSAFNHTKTDKTNDRSHFGISRFIESTPPREGRSPANPVLTNVQREEGSGPSAAPNGSLSFPTDQDAHKMREGANPSRKKDKTTPASLLINATSPSVRSLSTQKTVACYVDCHSKKGLSEESARPNSSEVFRKTTDTPDTRCKSNPTEEPVEEDLLAFLRKPLALARAAEQAALEKKLMEAKNKRKPRAKTTVRRSNLSDPNPLETVEQRTAAVSRTEKSRSQSRTSKSSYRSRSVKTHSTVSSHHVENPTFNFSSTGYLPRAGESLRNWIRLDMPLGQALLEVPLGEVAGQLKVRKVASANKMPAAAGPVVPPIPQAASQQASGANHMSNDQPSTSDIGSAPQPSIGHSQGLSFEQNVLPTSESNSQSHSGAADVPAAEPQKKPTTSRRKPTKAEIEAAGGDPNTEKPKRKRAPPRKKEPAQPSVQQQPTMNGTHEDPANMQQVDMQAQGRYHPYHQPQYNAHQSQSEDHRTLYNQPFPATATISRPMNPTPDHQRQQQFGGGAMNNNVMSSYNNGVSSTSSSFGQNPFEKKAPAPVKEKRSKTISFQFSGSTFVFSVAAMLAPLKGYSEKPLEPLPGTSDEIPTENQEQLIHYQMNQPTSSESFYYPPDYTQVSIEGYNGELENITYDQLVSSGFVAHSVESQASSNTRDSTSQSSQNSSLPQTPNREFRICSLPCLSHMISAHQMHQSQQANQSHQVNHAQQMNQSQQMQQSQQVDQSQQMQQSQQIDQSQQMQPSQQVNQSAQQGVAPKKRPRKVLTKEAIEYNAREFARAYGFHDDQPSGAIPRPLGLSDLDLEILTDELIGDFFIDITAPDDDTLSPQATRCSARSEISTPSDYLSSSSVSGPPSTSTQRVSQEEYHNTATQHVPQPVQYGFNQQTSQNVPSEKPLTLSDANVQYVSKQPTLPNHSSTNGNNYASNPHQQYRQMNGVDPQKDLAHQKSVGSSADSLQTGGKQIYYVQHLPSETSGTTMNPANGRNNMANSVGLSEEQSQLLFQQKGRRNSRSQRRKMDGEESPSTSIRSDLSVGEVLRNSMIQNGFITANKLDWSRKRSTDNSQYKYSTFVEKPSQEMPDNILESPEPEKSNQPDADSIKQSKNVKIQQILDKHLKSSEQYLVNQSINDQYIQQENVMHNGGGIVTHHESQRAATQPAAEVQPTQKTSLQTMLEAPTQEPLYNMPQQQVQHQHRQRTQQYQHTQQHQYHHQQQQGHQQPNGIPNGHVHSNMQSVMQQSSQQYSQQAVQHGTQEMASVIPPHNSNLQQQDPNVPVVQASSKATRKPRIQQPKKQAQNLQVQQQPQVQEQFPQQQQQQLVVQNTSGHYVHQQVQVQLTNGQPMHGQSVQRHPMQQHPGHVQYNSNHNMPKQAQPMQQVQIGHVQQNYQNSQQHSGLANPRQQNQYQPGHGQPAQTHPGQTQHVQHQQASGQQVQAPPMQTHPNQRQHGQPQQMQSHQVQYHVVHHQPGIAQQIQAQPSQLQSAPQSQMYHIVQSTPAQSTQFQMVPIQQAPVQHDPVKAAHIEKMQNKGTVAQPLTDEDLDVYDEDVGRTTTSTQPLSDQQMVPQQVQTHAMIVQRRPSQPLPAQSMQNRPMTITRTQSQPSSVHGTLSQMQSTPVQTMQLHSTQVQQMPNQPMPTDQQNPPQVSDLGAQNAQQVPRQPVQSNGIQAVQQPTKHGQAQRAKQQTKPNEKAAPPMLNHYVQIQPLPNTPTTVQSQPMDDQMMPVLNVQAPNQTSHPLTSSTHLMPNQSAHVQSSHLQQHQTQPMQHPAPLSQPSQNQQSSNYSVQHLPIQQQPMKNQLPNQTVLIRHEQLPQPSNQLPGSSNQVYAEKLPTVGENPNLAGLFPQNPSSTDKQPRVRKYKPKPKGIQPNQMVGNGGLPPLNPQGQHAPLKPKRSATPILTSMLTGEPVVADEEESANRLLTLYGIRPLAPETGPKRRTVTHQTSEETKQKITQTSGSQTPDQAKEVLNSQPSQQSEEAQVLSIEKQALEESQLSENPTETSSELSDQPKKKKTSKRKDQPKEVVLRGKKLREKMAEDTINEVIMESKIPLDDRESCWDRIRSLGIEEDFIEEFDENVAREMVENPSECEIMVDDVMNFPFLEPALHGRFRKRLELVREGGIPAKRKKTVRKSDDEGNSDSVGSSNGGLTNQQSSSGQSSSNGTHSAPLSVTTDMGSLNPSSSTMHMTTLSSNNVSAEVDREIITTLSSHHSSPHTFGINNDMSNISNMPTSSESSLSVQLGTNGLEQNLNTLNQFQQKPSNNNNAQSSSNDMMLSNFSMDDDFLLDNSPTIREDIILQSCRAASPLFLDPRNDCEEPVKPTAEPSLFDDPLKDFESMDSMDCNYMMMMNGPCAPEDLFVDQYAVADARCSSSSTIDEVIDNVASSSTVNVVGKSAEMTGTEILKTNGVQTVPEVGPGCEDRKSISPDSSNGQSRRSRKVLAPEEQKKSDQLFEQIKHRTKNFGKSVYTPRNSKPIIVKPGPVYELPAKPVAASTEAVAENTQPPAVTPIQSEVEAATPALGPTQSIRINADNVDKLLKGTGYEENDTETENNNCKFMAL
ncbi:hypothetical protein CAEBREN_15217 [Caenorhabditis brenneri]|uniref:Uncharacterized protein n=1 Tax=Caenorhabditis brenneri TaxID=135651 RepID=G0M874_CAEBE|nr:hypothetical protein CAEBREN_15217 [Caenorhabditis brenneri]